LAAYILLDLEANWYLGIISLGVWVAVSVAKLAIENAGLTQEQINFFVGVDLMNQIISTSFAQER
jgi:hypothetical protein